jgi:HAMP domain-containing protein
MSTNESYLTAVCQACRKRYGILAENISGNGGRFACKNCGAMVAVRKAVPAPASSVTRGRGDERLPDWVNSVEHIGAATVSDEAALGAAFLGAPPSEGTLPGAAPPEALSLEAAPAEVGPPSATTDAAPTEAAASVSEEPTVIREIQSTPVPPATGAASAKRAYRFGLTGKFLLFTLIPLVIISVLSLLYAIDRMRIFQRSTVEESTRIVKGISEGMLRQISNTVARQTRQYLFSHPDLKRQDFNRDIYFKKVAIQRVGVTGNTSLYEIAGADGIWRFWANIDAKLVGRNLEELKARLGKHFDPYWKLLTGVKEGKIVSGYYRWPDERGNFREKYMVCTPVEGTPYAVSAAIYLDEITVPLMEIEARGNALAREMRNHIAAILGGGLLLLALILFLYGRGLTRKIQALSAWADRISLGELDLETSPVSTYDELGELGEAIARMQDSIRLSVERLRRRRH